MCMVMGTSTDVYVCNCDCHQPLGWRWEASQPRPRPLGFKPCKVCAMVMHMPADDPVDHPNHYTAHPSGIECIQITEHMNFCIGNAVKYLWRADLKNGVEDLRKAAWYVAREIERRER